MAKKIVNVDDRNDVDNDYDAGSLQNSLFLIPATVSEVLNIIKNMNPNKVIKTVADFVSEPLVYVIN